MHIVISSKLFLPVIGGSVTYARMLATEFVKQHHQVSVITRTAGDSLTDEPYTLHRNLSFREKMRLAKTADILLQVDSSWQDALPFMLHRIPWLPTVHRGYPTFIGQPLHKQIRLMAERTAYLLGNTIAVSEATSKSWRLNGTVIPNPYDDTYFHEPAAGSVRDTDLLFVGSIVSHKGIFVLIEALRDLAGSAITTPLRIAFVGEGAGMTALKEAIRTLPPSMDFVIAGPGSPPEVADWMRRSRILVFPTTPEWIEASPLTPLEAAACGCLIVASDSGGTRENVSPTHWVVKSGDAGELSRAISEALSRKKEEMDQPTRELLEHRKVSNIAERYIHRFESFINTTPTL